MPDLAQRLLASAEEVREALRVAAQGGLLAVSGDPDDPTASLSLTWLPERPRPTRSRSRTAPDLGPVIDSPHYEPSPSVAAPAPHPAPGTRTVEFVWVRPSAGSPVEPFIDPPSERRRAWGS